MSPIHDEDAVSTLTSHSRSAVISIGVNDFEFGDFFAFAIFLYFICQNQQRYNDELWSIVSFDSARHFKCRVSESETDSLSEIRYLVISEFKILSWNINIIIIFEFFIKVSYI